MIQQGDPPNPHKSSPKSGKLRLMSRFSMLYLALVPLYPSFQLRNPWFRSYQILELAQLWLQPLQRIQLWRLKPFQHLKRSKHHRDLEILLIIGLVDCCNFLGIFWVDFFVGGLVQSLGLVFLVGGLLRSFVVGWGGEEDGNTEIL